jgi:type II secretory pathway pseudopilin PulG
MIPGRTSRDDHGFSLIELSIILVVLGIVLATFIPRMTRGIANDKVREAKEILSMAGDEIIGMAMMNGTSHLLPVPEGSEGNLVPESITHRVDPWGNRLYYYRSEDLSNATDTCYFCQTETNATKLGRTTPHVAFIIGSKGKNFVQDLDNATAPLFSIPLYGSNGYDDIVDFATLEYVQNKMGGHQRPGMPVTNALLAWYPFDGDARDGSLNGWDGALGTPSPTAGTDRFGCEESMYFFNGTETIEVVNGTRLDFNSTDGFSVAFWIRAAEAAANGTVVSKMNSTDSRGYAIDLDRGYIRMLLADNATAPNDNALLVNATESLAPGAWTHVVTAYKGVLPNANATVSDIAIYLNGADKTSSTAVVGYGNLNGTISCPGTAFTIGGSGKFDLDEVAVFNSTLSDYEVEILYEQTRPTHP